MPENALAGGEEVDSSLPQESNLNSGSIAVEVSIFYNSAAAAVNELHLCRRGIVASTLSFLCIAKVIVGVKGRAVIGRIIHRNNAAGRIVAEAENSCAAARTDSHAYKKTAVVIIVRYGAV